MNLLRTNAFMYILLGLLVLGIVAYVMNNAALLMILLALVLILIVLKIIANFQQRASRK
ncbi:hypothetical protein [Lacticaseibacillus brantae]|nr:hypothetical protein [Lacticaseibacillus brantae]